MAFHSFFFSPLGLIALSGTSSRILNCAGDNGQPYLISDFSGNTSDNPKKYMFAVGFGEIAFIKLRWAPCIHGWLRVVFLFFKSQMNVDFLSSAFLAATEMTI